MDTYGQIDWISGRDGVGRGAYRSNKDKAALRDGVDPLLIQVG